MKTKKVDIVAGYSYPNDKYALWFDQNTNTLKYWDGEKWESSSNSGSSLPIPTADDVGKVMMVVDKETETTERVTIVPQQTVQWVGKSLEADIQNVNYAEWDTWYDYLDSSTVIIDGEDCDYTPGGKQDSVRWLTGNYFYVDLDSNTLISTITTVTNPGVHTIEIYVNIPVKHHEYVWEMQNPVIDQSAEEQPSIDP